MKLGIAILVLCLAFAVTSASSATDPAPSVADTYSYTSTVIPQNITEDNEAGEGESGSGHPLIAGGGNDNDGSSLRYSNELLGLVLLLLGAISLWGEV
jgi:hypothetical protein